jgi:mRNA-degrading endonuclease RelE of RelBE toxin-antitoxin system
MPYRLFIAVEVIELLESLKRPRRRELLAQFRRLQDFPGHYSDYIEADETGRRVDVSVFRGLAIYYWVDEADRHVKILKLAVAD